MLSLPFLAIGLSFSRLFATRKIDDVSAHSLIRCWHELHVVQDMEHDFGHMLAPSRENNIFFAAEHNGLIYAIGQCRDTPNGTRVQSLAYAPHNMEAAAALVRLLYKIQIVCDLERLPPRWRCEGLFVNEDSTVD